MNAPAVVVVGEALVDLLVDTDPRHPVAWPGGSPANTAIALARLGTPVGFAGRSGNDRFGDLLLLANLTANGVDLAYAVEADEPTSLAVVTRGPDSGASYGFHVAGTADWSWVSVAERWRRELVVVTFGAEGVVGVLSGHTVHRPAVSVSVVDTVGAGDAFSGGLLHWLAEHGRLDRLADLSVTELAQALDYASAVAALACARPGADPSHAHEVAVQGGTHA